MEDKIVNSVRVIVFGATGDVGRCLVRAGLDLGQDVTAFVRAEDKLRTVLGGRIPKELNVIVGDALDQEAVGKAIESHNAVVNAAGSRVDMEILHKICLSIVAQAEKHLLPPRRIWLFGGIPALDVPNKKYAGIDLPGMPERFEVHRKNYELLKNSSLDWSFMCPGPMFFANGQKTPGELRITTEVMPYSATKFMRWLPSPLQSLIFLKRVAGTAVAYEDVANFVMSNLSQNGHYYKKRVGVALATTKRQI